jgi:hypothetical protein
MELSKIVKNHQAFSERILTELDKVPFGSLQKVELELVILDAIIKSLEPIDSYSNLEKHFSHLQSLLKLTQTQLKNKILAAQLRYDRISEQDTEKYILKSIQKGEFSIDGSNIIIPIFNPLLNEKAKIYFETRGIISDTSFNKTILKINLNGFILFIFQLDWISNIQKNKIEKILNKEKSDGSIIVVSDDNKFSSDYSNFEALSAVGSNLLSIINQVINVMNQIF